MAQMTGAYAAKTPSGSRARAAGNARLKMFARASLFDALLVVGVSACLIAVVSHGFYSAQAISGNVALDALLSVPFVVVLFAGAWSKRALVPAAAGYAALIVVDMAVCSALSAAAGPAFLDGVLQDVAESYVIFGIIVAVVPAAVFLLSRRMAGLAVLLFGAAIAVGALQFLYRDWAVLGSSVATCVALFCLLIAMFVFQGYRASAQAATWMEKPHFASALASAVVLGLLCTGVATLLFFLIIMPLGLATPEIKPFQDYYSRPVVEYTGVYDSEEVENPDLVTNMTDDDQDDAKNDAQTGSKSKQEDDAGSTSPTMLQQLASTLLGYDVTSWEEGYRAIGYQLAAYAAAALLLLIVLAAALAIALRRHARTKRLKKLAGMPYAQRVTALYRFLVAKFARLGLVKPDAFTPLEFAFALRRDMLPYTRGTGGVDFVRVTLIYQRAAYGSGELSQQEYQEVERYYKAFFKNARRQSGVRKWLYRFWRI